MAKWFAVERNFNGQVFPTPWRRTERRTSEVASSTLRYRSACHVVSTASTVCGRADVGSGRSRKTRPDRSRLLLPPIDGRDAKRVLAKRDVVLRR